jgi:type 1 glutamine amidotransferase
MKLRLALICAALFSLALSTPARSADEPAHKVKALFLTQSKGFKHGPVTRKNDTLAPAEIAMTQLGQQTGLFDLHCTQDAAADITKDNLKNYDVVMFYTTLDLPISHSDLEYFVNDWLKQKGHGFMGFHSAADTYHNEPLYWEMLGATFNGHPWGSGTTVTVTVDDPNFPASKPFGKEFKIKDEIYQYKGPDKTPDQREIGSHWHPENVHLLMSLNMEKCNPKKPYHVPLAWVKEWGQGKIFYTNLGHNEKTWTNKTFLKSVENAVRWIRNMDPGDATPNPDVSKAEDEKAKAAASGSQASR